MCIFHLVPFGIEDSIRGKRMTKQVLFTLLCVTVLSVGIYRQEAEQEEITASELYDHIAFLASETLEGRKPGTAGGHAAASYIVDQLRRLRVQLLGEDGYQYFEVVIDVEAGEGNRLRVGDFQGTAGIDFIPLSFSENAALSAPVTFAGYGFDIESDSITWRDYDSVDVSGRWVMLLFGDPEIERMDSPFVAHSAPRQKVLKAKDEGAGGVLFVSGPSYDEKDELSSLSYDQSPSSSGLPVLHISRKIADRLLRANSTSIATLEEELIRQRRPSSFSLEVTLTAEAEVVKKKATTQNVVALLPGGDAALKDQYVVLGAHYDHLGFGGAGSGSRRPDTSAVHNGADDNASGVAAILEIFERFAEGGTAPGRSIVFAAFAAEEMGLLGSKYFVDNPPVHLDSIICMINLDMVGRLNETTKSVSVGGTGTAAGLSDLVQSRAASYGLNASLSPEGLGPSDHASFYAEDIPVLFLSTGAHDDYHTPDDDVEGINIQGEKEIADFVYDVAADFADRREPLVFQEAGPKQRPSVRRRFRVTLGIMPDFTSTEKNGLRVNAVTVDRPAYRAGIKKGDIIVEMEGRTVADIYEYMYRLGEFESGQRISVAVLRGSEKLIFIVEL